MKPSPRQLAIAATFAAIALVTVVATASSAIKQGNGTFTVDPALSKPTTLGPTNGSTLTYPTDPIKLTWRPVPGAVNYEVQVARQSSSGVDCDSNSAWATENILFTHTTSDLGWVPQLTSEETGSQIWTGTFCWRVRAAGTTPGTWSTSPRFTVSWPATATDLRFYSDENGDVPRSGAADSTGFDTGYLSWSAVEGAPRYEVQISESPTFASASLFATKIYPGTRMLLPMLPDNNYTWRVRPIAANGVRGNWSSAATFTIQRDTRYWDDASTLYPANDADVDDIRVGWEPVPGASYYRYMASTSISGFTELETMSPYGLYNDACLWMNSRLSSQSEAASSTINNWVTAAALFDTDVQQNLYTWCSDNTTRAPIPSRIHWRVYPVWQLSDDTESGWDVPTRTINGSAVQRYFDVDPYDASASTPAPAASGGLGMVDNDSCTGSAGFPGQPDCLRLIGGAMSPLDSSINSSTMQVPYFEWGAYAHRASFDTGVLPYGDNGEGPGSFRVQIARDSAFNNMVKPASAPTFRGWIANKGPAKMNEWAESSVGMTRFGSVTRSFAFTTGLPDEGQDGNGYFWRAIPCQSFDDFENNHTLCQDFYTEATGAGQSPGIVTGTPGSGALEFRKRVEVSTQVVSGFTDTVPMLRVGPVGATGYQQWQRGIQGADHYEFELARSASFDQSKVLKTTVPRIVPWGATPADPLEPGTWYWRVRAIDRDGLAGTWSAASTFSIDAQAPAPASSSAASGVGGLVEWSRVPGAIEYQVAWSKDTGFNSGVSTSSTAQAAFFVPAKVTGSFRWRVRAKTGENAYGPWSASREITILAPTRISYGTSATKVSAGSVFIAEAQLLVAGSARNGQAVQLQRKSTSCQASGRYSRIASATTGRNIDDGFVRLRVRASRTYCYRFAWAFATGTVYSAAFEVKALPVVRMRLQQTSVSRGKPFCATVTSRQPLNGRMRIQYRLGTTWLTARSERVRGFTRGRKCAVINRGGTFRVRVIFDQLNHPTQGYKMYDPVAANGGSVRSADRFVIM